MSGLSSALSSGFLSDESLVVSSSVPTETKSCSMNTYGRGEWGALSEVLEEKVDKDENEHCLNKAWAGLVYPGPPGGEDQVL